jgi:hypothetical protein
MKANEAEKWKGPPPYFLRLVDKVDTKKRTIAGAVFPGPYGQFNVVLNPGIVIKWDDALYISLVPNDGCRGGKGKLEHSTDDGQAPPKGSDDEFPF